MRPVPAAGRRSLRRLGVGSRTASRSSPAYGRLDARETLMGTVHMHSLPAKSAMLAGRGPVSALVGVVTDRVQIYWRTSDGVKADALSHAHERSDESFFVLTGSMTFELETGSQTVPARSFCHFPIGVFHRIASVTTPL